MAELKAWTPASLSPSNGVTGLLAFQAEVAVRRIGELHTDPVEIDAYAVAVDERGREGLLHDQLEGVVAIAVLVGAEVADVLSGAERRPGLLEDW